MITSNDRITTSSKYKLLDTYHVENAFSTCLAILRKVQFRNTKDGKPYIRALLEDVNGLVVVGRMFDIALNMEQGRLLRSLIGGLCKVSYTPDYFGGSLGLAISSIEAVPQEEADPLAASFTGKFKMATTMLRACNQLLIERNFSAELNDFRTTYCNLQPLLDYSDERISRGLRGYILNIIHSVLTACRDASNEAIVAFLYAIITECDTERNIDAYMDDSSMLFVASMMDRRVETAAANLQLLSSKISEFAALFIDKAKVISHDTFLLYRVYRDLCEASNIAVVESQLPPQGFCVYKGYTIRKE